MYSWLTILCYAAQTGLAVCVSWADDAVTDMARKQTHELLAALEATAKKRNLFLEFQFMNDASYTQSPLRSYGAEGLASLRKVSRKWDEDAVFQKLQSPGFLLSCVNES